MKNIVNFDNYQDFERFIDDKCTNSVIGYGAEGECILSRDGTNLYKVLEMVERLGSPVIPYDVNKVITIDDIDLKHYILPSELYALKGTLIGYKAKYIEGEDLFSMVNLSRLHKEKNIINFDALAKSYYVMEKETDMLSKEKIILFDLMYNVMFINNQLYGVDTCGYRKTHCNVFDINREILRESFVQMFKDWVLYDNYVSYDDSLRLEEEKDMEKYFKKLERIIAKR